MVEDYRASAPGVAAGLVGRGPAGLLAARTCAGGADRLAAVLRARGLASVRLRTSRLATGTTRGVTALAAVGLGAVLLRAAVRRATLAGRRLRGPGLREDERMHGARRRTDVVVTHGHPGVALQR